MATNRVRESRSPNPTRSCRCATAVGSRAAKNSLSVESHHRPKTGFLNTKSTVQWVPLRPRTQHPASLLSPDLHVNAIWRTTARTPDRKSGGLYSASTDHPHTTAGTEDQSCLFAVWPVAQGLDGRDTAVIISVGSSSRTCFPRS